MCGLVLNAIIRAAAREIFLWPGSYPIKKLVIFRNKTNFVFKRYRIGFIVGLKRLFCNLIK